MGWNNYIPKDVSDLYEVHDYKHAAAIFSQEFPNEFREIIEVLRDFRFTLDDLKAFGGNKGTIVKRFEDLLRPRGWEERELGAKILVDTGRELELGTHKVDFVKGRVAFDLEWNSKDQTFDRDLYAFRAFYEYDVISLGILVTRSRDLDPLIASLGKYVDRYGTERDYLAKFGASTTHIGKLLPRLDAGRNGGCPVLVLGITRKLLEE